MESGEIYISRVFKLKKKVLMLKNLIKITFFIILPSSEIFFSGSGCTVENCGHVNLIFLRKLLKKKIIMTKKIILNNVLYSPNCRKT